LKIKVFNDFIQPNQQLAEKNLDANYYQYRPFLDNYNQTRHTHLVPVVGVHIEPFGAYSSKYTTSKRCRMAPPIAIPNDPVNTGRALVMLSNAGLITLKIRTIRNRRPRISPPTRTILKFASWKAPCWRGR
jgi:D-methionine transport system substrate-binding protein